MLNKKLISCTLMASMLISLCSCRMGSAETSTQPTTATSEVTEATTTITAEETESSEPETSATETSVQTGPVDGATLEDKLNKLERVRSIEKMDVLRDDKEGRTSMKEKYVVFFDLPLDWNDPDKGTFPLRTIFSFVDDNATNTFLCDGYFIYDMDVSRFDFRRDLSWFYNTNEVQMEHRFYGESVPEGLSIDSLDYWEYLTDENAAEDFHFVITQFKRILTGKCMFTGSSKGGQLTHMQSYFHPEDADVFVSYVAPGGSEQDAPDFFDYIYTEIGDSAYGADKAKKYRDMVLQFQVEAIKNRDTLAQRYYDRGVKDGCVFTDFTTPDILYDMAVLEFATTTWQYFQEFKDVKNVLNNKGSKEPAHLDKILDMLYETNPASIWAHNSEYFAYYVQAATQNGEHEYDFSFLRKALDKDGSGAKLAVTEDMEKGLLFRMVFTPEQYEAFKFDPTIYNNMVKWSHETDSLVLMVYGQADVWYTVRLPDVTDNENIHIFKLPHASHMTSFERMDKDMADEVEKLLDPILKWE
ncbi:MAG: hypothetical protein J6X33_00035 [Clostridiales bacterium]|nr:hypothetical protein [Clostridiales bacterium]